MVSGFTKKKWPSIRGGNKDLWGVLCGEPPKLKKIVLLRFRLTSRVYIAFFSMKRNVYVYKCDLKLFYGVFINSI